jgi:hypothetical protein
MKKLLLILPLVAALTACGTTSSDRFDRRVEREQDRRDKAAVRAIKKSPDWMTELPRSNNAVYANGTAVSSDMGMAANKAKLMAYGKICMASGGRVNQNSRIFLMDSENATAEQSELAIQSMCPNVDISGVETVDTQTIAENGRFRSYVLVALPTGGANQIQGDRDRRANQARMTERAGQVFQETPLAPQRPQYSH